MQLLRLLGVAAAAAILFAAPAAPAAAPIHDLQRIQTLYRKQVAEQIALRINPGARTDAGEGP